MPNYRAEARRAARRFGLDPGIFERQIQQESGFAQDVITGRRVSSASAQGIAQIIPSTARSWGVNPLDPIAALNAAAKHMAGYVKQYGSYDKALRAYNAGPGKVEESRGFSETNNYVKRILGGRSPSPRGVTPKGGGGRGGGGGVQLPSTDLSGTGAATGLLSALQTIGQRERPQVTLPAAPAFSARAAMPAGYQAPETSGPPRQSTDLTEALAQVAELSGGNLDVTSGLRAGGRAGGRGGGGGGGLVTGGSKPRVAFAAGANRPGVSTTRLLKNALSQLSSVSGAKVVVGTGTNHSQMTTSGNVSDHWTGNGADIPLAGNQLTKRGRQALVAYGMSPGQAKKAKGGIYNLNWRGHRVQVIFNTTEGGNHWNHLHVGIR